WSNPSMDTFVRFAYTYNSQGLVDTLQYENYYNSTWWANFREVYTYTPLQQEDSTTNYTNHMGVWNDYFQYKSYYDAQDRLLYRDTRRWMGEWVTQYRDSVDTVRTQPLLVRNIH